MTAEIAILNKTAVALAADSAVTISAGSRQEKIFDSADKLFELSDKNPIGIMIYNGMSFMEVPLPSLIREFRISCPAVQKVEEAANKFLSFLDDFGRAASPRVKEDAIDSIVRPWLGRINERYFEKFRNYIVKTDKLDSIKEYSINLLNIEIAAYKRILEGRNDASFVEIIKPIQFKLVHGELLRRIVDEVFPNVNEEQKESLLEIAILALQKDFLSDGLTGIVISGFGCGDLFPTLISFEIDGIVGGHLKYNRTNNVDIDREGPKARVLPFAQKEMVERFLYGLDDNIEKQVTRFCDDTIPDIHKQILERIDFDKEEDKEEINKRLSKLSEHSYKP